MRANDCGLDQVVVALAGRHRAHDGAVALPHGERAWGVADRDCWPTVLHAEVLAQHGDFAAATSGPVVGGDTGDDGFVVPRHSVTKKYCGEEWSYS